MANKEIFKSASSSIKVPVADTINEAGGKAYSLNDKHALAQYCITACTGNTYYADARVQLDKILELTAKLDPTYIAKCAVYCRKSGYMKDTPALLCAVLASRDVETLKCIFNDVIDNGKMLRNFVQMIRSGKVGRKSFGTSIKKMIQRWFTSRTDRQLFADSVGNDPSLADVIKLVHPAPSSKSREALYGYICGKKVVFNAAEMEKHKDNFVTVLIEDLPECVQKYEIYKKAILAGDHPADVPDVQFQLLTALKLGEKEWTAIAEKMYWTATRMNLNTLLRQGVLKSERMVDMVADRLRNPEEVKKSRCFPYQLLCAYKNVEPGVPVKITNALHDAMEVATENVPEIKGKVYIMVDVSGSMHSSVTGYKPGVPPSQVRCVDVASLMAASLLRRNRDAEVIPFHTKVELGCRLNPHDSVMTNADKLAKCPSGGTACSVPIQYLNNKKAAGDMIIMISDNESWADMDSTRARGWGGTSAHAEWAIFKKRNPKARFVAIDITPYGTAQVQEGSDVVNVGGFSDNVFEIVTAFANGELDKGHFVGVIEKVELKRPTPVTPSVVASAKAGVQKAKQKRDNFGRFI